jgi:lysophospholipase L1-like esterase
MPVTLVNPFLLSSSEEAYRALAAADAKRILAEGDSWMSVFRPGQGNLLSFIETTAQVVILDLSYPGDTLAQMASGGQFELFRRLTGDARHGYAFDLILLLGGGNDVIGAGLERFLVGQGRRPGRLRDCIHEKRLKAVLAEVGAHFEKFLAALGESELNAATPILACTYDYVTPREAGITVLGATLDGPWILPVMREKGIADPRLQKAITDHLLRRFRRLLFGLARRHRKRFVVVDTLGTLAPAIAHERESADWADEIHPSAAGWRKLAKRFEPEIERLLAA